ncbi:MAG TPA: hypothetical protein VFJ91_07400 [Gaiellaceae bacterium]|nr:hypothetical protein [Gaiellaceae bacterium]
MSVANPPTAAEPEALRTGTRSLSDRLLLAAPLASVYIWLCVVYAVEALGHKAPWLFPDELKTTQLARSLADTGHAAQRGAPHSFESFFTLLHAPIWLIGSTTSAYTGLRYVDVLVMTSVVFPTYFLARMLVRRPAALFAAVGAGVIPSLAYSGYLVQENLAYPYSTLALFLLARALVAVREQRHVKRWVVPAVLAALLSPLVRGELAVILAIVPLAAFFAVWSSEWARDRRSRWPLGDRVGAWLLIAGGAFFVMALAGSQSAAWLRSWVFLRHRIVNMTDWAAGALAIGIGVIPFAVGLAALARTPSEREGTAWEVRVFRSVLLASLLGYGLYTGVKAAYLSSVFATRVEERNLIYVVPLLFVGLAFVLDRRSVNRWALAVTGAFSVYLVGYALYHPTQYPYELKGLYSDSLGLAILSKGSSLWGWSADDVRWLLVAIALGTLLAVFAIAHPRVGRRVALALSVALAVGVVGWSFSGELAAASESNAFAREFAAIVSPKGDGQPLNWVDRWTRGKPTLYEGVGEIDQNAEWVNEFFNRSIVSVGSLDGSLDGPGPAGAPNTLADGRVYWTDLYSQTLAGDGPQYDFAVEDYPCVDFAGRWLATRWHRAGAGALLRKPWRLVELTHPNRLRAECAGLYPDGWSGADDSGYFRFSGPAHGWLRIVVSRRNWGGPTPPSPVRVLLGTLVIGPDKYPHLGRVTQRHSTSVASSETQVLWLPVRSSRFAVRVVVAKKFVPHDYVPSNGDVRTLGAQVTYQIFPTLPKGASPAR